MIKRYFRKLDKLVRNPSKIKYVPSFLKQEFALWTGREKAEVNRSSCDFVINSLSEYDRINGFKDEREIIEKIMEEVDEETVFYDIGANIGTHSCFVGKAGAKVYAFEPFPENARSLKKNFNLNNIDGKVLEVALMNENSEMMLEEESGEPGEGMVRISDSGDLKTQVYKGDELIDKENLEKPDILKIDVEGAELEVLKGLEKTLETAKTLFVELHEERIKNFKGSSDDVEIFLEERGFKLQEVKTRRDETYLKARSVQQN